MGIVRNFFILACLACSMLGMLQAQDVTEASALEALRPLVGKTFKTTFPNGQLTDEHTYTAVYGSHFIRDVHYVKDLKGEVVYEGETVFAKDPQSGKVVWWYWNATGGYVTGTLEIKDGELHFFGKNHGPQGQTEKVHSVISNLTAKTYTSTSFFWKEDAWQKQWAVTFDVVTDP